MSWTSRFWRLIPEGRSFARSVRLHERVASAHTSSLIRLDVDELPADLRAPFQSVINAPSRVPEGGEEGTSTIRAVTLSDCEARRLIESIVSMTTP